MSFVTNWLIPIIKVVFIGGLMGWICFMVVKAFHNAWTKAWKFSWRYDIRKKAYPERITNWIFSCIDAGIGWYDAKKLMMVKMTPTDMMNETLWIYDKILLELNKQKGGIKNNGRQFERSHCKEIGEYPTI